MPEKMTDAGENTCDDGDKGKRKICQLNGTHKSNTCSDRSREREEDVDSRIKPLRQSLVGTP